jgi:hypothetical protein
VVGLSFCPSCGLNSAEGADRPAAPSTDRGFPPEDALGRPFDGGSSNVGPPPAPAGSPSVVLRGLLDPASRGTTIILGALIIAAGLVVFGLLMRPQPGAVPAAPLGGSSQPAGGSAVAPAAPIVGLTIQSPSDGQAVATKEVNVIGLAPPGLTVTRDVSFGLDQHGTADGTGHWAINVGLDEGQNDLVFRIGDDRSTEKRLRVIYTPQAP